MSIEPRPEAGPAMGDLSCEGLGHFIDYCKWDLNKNREDISSLSITDDNSIDMKLQDKRFNEAINYLSDHTFTLPEDILRLRRSILASEELFEGNSDADIKGKGGYNMQLRIMHLSRCQIDESGFKALYPFIFGHSTLSALYMTHNGFIPTLPFAMQQFAWSLSMSNLRILELNNNHIGTRSMVQFLDHIDMPSLTHLTLSMTMLRQDLNEDQRRNPLWTSSGEQQWRKESPDDVWKGEMSRVGNSVVELISSGRRGGYAPRLERLSLNGNDLGWKTVKKIVSAILNGNRSLIEVELFATTKPEDSEDEDEDTINGATPTLRRIRSIGTIYYQNRQANRPNHGQGNATPPRNDTLNKQVASTQAAAKISLTKTNWRGELGRHLWKNRLGRRDVKDVSRYMLPIVRVLSCKCRESPSSNTSKDTFPFTSLPPEIRDRVVSFLDDKSVLSSQQIKRIISFASNAATLGYGCKSANLGLSDMALQQIKKEAQGVDEEDVNGYGLIPHYRWSWKKMMRDHPMPRDWPATVLDEGMRRAKAEEGDDDHRDLQGLGGGGPDGRGGLTYERPGPDAARRRWLEEQSGLHAFWESTGTYRED